MAHLRIKKYNRKRHAHMKQKRLIFKKKTLKNHV